MQADTDTWNSNDGVANVTTLWTAPTWARIHMQPHTNVGGKAKIARSRRPVCRTELIHRQARVDERPYTAFYNTSTIRICDNTSNHWSWAGTDCTFILEADCKCQGQTWLRMYVWHTLHFLLRSTFAAFFFLSRLPRIAFDSTETIFKSRHDNKNKSLHL